MTTDFPIEFLKKELENYNITLNAEQCERFCIYKDELVSWNEKINLTAITDSKEIAIKHFLDSALLLVATAVPQNAKVIDVGTGAGFPGVVIKILRPDIELTLLDGLNKRLVFLDDLLSKLKLTATTVHKRAEEGGRDKNLRESFDIATARAVAKLNVLSEYCMPFVKKGGEFIALKGPAASEEIDGSEKAVSVLGGSKPKVCSFFLPDDDKRNIIIVKKISQTPPKYPRISAKIQKQPL